MDDRRFKRMIDNLLDECKTNNQKAYKKIALFDDFWFTIFMKKISELIRNHHISEDKFHEIIEGVGEKNGSRIRSLGSIRCVFKNLERIRNQKKESGGDG